MNLKQITMHVGEVEVSYKYKSELINRPEVKSSSDAYEILKKFIPKNKIGLQEHFITMFLNRRNKVIGVDKMFIGGISETAVDIKIIAAASLKIMASSIIVAHNHPSGNLMISDCDRDLTDKIKSALKLFEINLLDHIIISPDDCYLSFSDEGLLY